MDSLNFLEVVRLIAERDTAAVARRLREVPSVARIGLALREGKDCFLPQIRHQVYGGDTPLHIAAAAGSRPIAELLVANGADCRARNRRGAEPLHYAADGNGREPGEQAEVIAYLVSMGADPNAADKSGVAPLHRAVRRRSLEAVRALLDAGASSRRPNKSGSTPLHLAVQSTGASLSGTGEARRQQAGIIKLLLERGAKLGDKDGRGRRADQAATCEWVRRLLRESRAG